MQCCNKTQPHEHVNLYEYYDARCNTIDKQDAFGQLAKLLYNLDIVVFY